MATIEDHLAEIGSKVSEEMLKPAKEDKNEYTKEYIKKYSLLTVGRLLDFIEKNNISRDSTIFIERIHDLYFKYNNWETVQKTFKWNDKEDGYEEMHEYIHTHGMWSDGDHIFIDSHY